MANKKLVANKSVGNTKKTPKYKPNSIVVLMSLLISQKFLNYGHCQEFLIEEYETKITNYLERLGYNKDEIKKLFTSNKALSTYCKDSYSMSKQGNSKFYSLLQNVNIDAAFKEIIAGMPRDFVNACVNEKALGDMLGVLVSKKITEVWGYFASMTKMVDDNLKSDLKKQKGKY